MLIGHFTEWPWQDSKTGLMGTQTMDLRVSNNVYDPEVGALLYNRYLDEKIYLEEVGFDGLMLNEHHSTPFCMQGVTNVGLSIMARETKRVKIIVLGNVLPLWDDPLWLAEHLAMVDMISGGRVVTGWVRGGGRESVSHSAPPTYNRERFEEAHDFIVKTWTTPGPFRWEGKHYQYRYVNPWAMPLQKPHPQMWIPTTVSVETVRWAALHRYPVVMLSTALGPTKQSAELYHQVAKEAGYEAGTQHTGYLWKVHVDETEELADTTGRKYLSGVSNPFVAGNEGIVNQALLQLPGHTSRTSQRLAAAALGPLGRGGALRRSYEDQIADYTIVSGTPKAALPRIRHVLETLRPGSVFFWDGDGAMTHDDQMRSARLMGQEVIPALREMAKELSLVSSFESNDGTGISPAVRSKVKAQ
jgi:alkanesulfonate monooxygenase SsuD/methylene tetrahydromethanopterin reductase-like flavin-dependent oxidoreductase (luciferase family)